MAGIRKLPVPRNGRVDYQRSRVKLIEGDDEALIVRLVGADKSVLDCGCGSGRVARGLVANGCRMLGIELDADRTTKAKEIGLRVVHGSLTEAATWQEVNGETFDVVLFSHVVEHLVEAAEVLRTAVRYVKPGGRIVAAVPNVANWRTRLHLLSGRWDYQDWGILDRTHVVFFTLESVLEFFRSAGFDIVTINAAIRPPGGSFPRRVMVRLLRRLIPVTLYAQSFVFELQHRPGPHRALRPQDDGPKRRDACFVEPTEGHLPAP